ncbi:PIN2/TERF1-interacting telomerase inhibitor 1 [Phycodurus eques]|uniref:PIN2/TERF1-interacting telomerase inhibitor 1 n=1 Tax=Phycodurus eques TaxID=693459 RepID=UPI002ACD9759|nr:PIN2/TERF1-interacting telomerase inhibitor 1 [Phycodurus eques]
MSMLAEPRRKQKWSTDPRNSAWSNDDSKFGQKMLERMGWSKGKGLGRSEQGATEHVQVKVKNNCYGLGAHGSQEDNWIAHQEDFNDLLAQLNNCHGQNNNNSSSSGKAESPPEEQKGFSLEEKSKTSKKRVHYMKFAKGKDLSSRSATDLNCIFGKRAKSAAHPEQESAESPTDESPTAAAAAARELDTESIAKTVTSTLTTQEYFAQRMARLKTARRQVAADARESEEPEQKKKKKKADTVSGLERAAEPSKKRPNEDAAKENLAEEKRSEERKKKKKKPKYKTEMPSATPAVEPEEKSGEEQELVVHKKSKKLKKKQRSL